MPIFDAEFLSRLETLTVMARRTYAGRTRGERKSPRKGASIEFADYKSYSSGDDLRYLDWSVYGRLDRLFLKLFHEEEDLYVHLLLDASTSMSFGDPPKFDTARRIAAAIAWTCGPSTSRRERGNG